MTIVFTRNKWEHGDIPNLVYLERDQDTRLLENILVKVTWHYFELVSKSKHKIFGNLFCIKSQHHFADDEKLSDVLVILRNLKRRQAPSGKKRTLTLPDIFSRSSSLSFSFKTTGGVSTVNEPGASTLEIPVNKDGNPSYTIRASGKSNKLTFISSMKANESSSAHLATRISKARLQAAAEELAAAKASLANAEARVKTYAAS
ncbi:hypothetical protein OSB04_019956 [Centaurea solstitialis]|uniref:Uncharacterized protein n=1 Tax=Centaurea solstitialis TaxID=347529 RepID=A0AA38SYX4_9ASTR|nr:hypothetical protein OSB04_019956 [Centaurea solstitialis]